MLFLLFFLKSRLHSGKTLDSDVPEGNEKYSKNLIFTLIMRLQKWLQFNFQHNAHSFQHNNLQQLYRDKCEKPDIVC